MRNNQKGFGVVEIFLVVIIIGLLVAVGWLFIDRRNSKNSNVETNPSATEQTAKTGPADPEDEYKGWTKCKDDNEKVSFKYPASWKGSCKLIDTNGDGQQFGLDLTSSAKFPEVFRVLYGSGDTDGGFSGSNKPNTVADVTPLSVKFNNKPLYTVMFADEWTEKGKVLNMVLSDTEYSVGQSATVTGVHSAVRPGRFIDISAALGDYEHQGQQFTAAQYKSSSDYQDVIKLFKSLKLE